MKPYIYRRKIVATGKYYVGKHNGNNSRYKGSGVEYKEDLKKYKETELEILEYVDDISKLNEREIYWLKKLDVVNNPLYYNKTDKSYGVCKTSEETKQKQSKSSPFKKQIIQYSLDGNFIKIWECMNDVSKELNISTGDLTCCCQEKQKSVGGFQWKYFINNYPSNIEKYNPEFHTEEWCKNHSDKMKGKPQLKPEGFMNYRKKEVYQYDKQGNFIKKYESLTSAQQQNPGCDISSCLRNKTKTAGGYVWKYKNN